MFLKVSALEHWRDGLRLVELTDRREYWSVDKKASNPFQLWVLQIKVDEGVFQ
jgi:hypothetical protein